MHMNTEVLHRNSDEADPRQPRLLLAGGYGSDTNFPMHDHPCWELIYQRTGRVRTQQGQEMIDMCPGMVLLHPPHVSHADWATEPYQIFYLYLDLAEAPAWPRLRFDDERQSIGKLCDELCYEYHSSHDDRMQMIDLLIRRLILLLDRPADHRQSDHEQTVAAARDVIDERYHTPLTVDDLASAAGVSRTCLHVSFSRVLEESPMEYLRNVRIRHAISIIRHTNETLDAVAERTGFHSASHLSRHIKAATGSPPGALRRERSIVSAENG